MVIVGGVAGPSLLLAYFVFAPVVLVTAVAYWCIFRRRPGSDLAALPSLAQHSKPLTRLAVSMRRSPLIEVEVALLDKLCGDMLNTSQFIIKQSDVRFRLDEKRSAEFIQDKSARRTWRPRWCTSY